MARNGDEGGNAPAAGGWKAAGWSGMAVGSNKAVLNDLGGWLWAATAAKAGPAIAAAEPLPGDDEAAARHYARQSAADETATAREWVRDVARYSAWLAIDSYRTYVQRRRELLEAKSPSNEMVRRVDRALADSDCWGSLAARWNRVLLLLSREQGGVQ